MVNVFVSMIGNIFFVYFYFSCVFVEFVVNVLIRNIVCIFYNYMVKDGICKNLILSFYVFGDSIILKNGEIEIEKMVCFFCEV